MHNTRYCPKLLQAVSGRVQALSGAFGQFRELPESARNVRKRPKVSESARNCSEQFRAVPK
eukprot:13803416-Alexandrium_andersonii.AAC.1